jgi:hypothetical protein
MEAARVLVLSEDQRHSFDLVESKCSIHSVFVREHMCSGIDLLSYRSLCEGQEKASFPFRYALPWRIVHAVHIAHPSVAEISYWRGCPNHVQRLCTPYKQSTTQQTLSSLL